MYVCRASRSSKTLAAASGIDLRTIRADPHELSRTPRGAADTALGLLLLFQVCRCRARGRDGTKQLPRHVLL